MPRLTLAAAAMALTAGLALAQTTAPTPAPGAAPSAGPAREGGAPRADYQALQSVRLSLAQAVEAAEAQGGGGRAVSAEFERAERNEPAYFEVKVLQGDGRLVEHTIDAQTGQVKRSENQPVERFFERLKPEDVRAAATSLRQAIALAEQRGGAGARAVEAEIDREGGVWIYEIDVVTPERRREIRIGMDGQVVGG